jgi:hypothetical protein
MGILGLLETQTGGIVVHHDVPMKLDNAVKRRNLFNAVHVEETGFGIEKGHALFAVAVVELGVLSKKETCVAAESVNGVGIKVPGFGFLPNLGRFLHHGNDILVDKLARPQPTTHGPYFALFLAKAVDSRPELVAALLNGLEELGVGVGLRRRQMTGASPQEGIGVDALAFDFLSFVRLFV